VCEREREKKKKEIVWERFVRKERKKSVCVRERKKRQRLWERDRKKRK
jgi:hypothetical protein